MTAMSGMFWQVLLAINEFVYFYKENAIQNIRQDCTALWGANHIPVLINHIEAKKQYTRNMLIFERIFLNEISF